ncbi:hypothetical protein ATANTOWER_032007 [Ataeniobius toweri]|uniref:Uncharacterized protein n=1 Tax=Ataeniobius toweri TaxID=208326 RepID=A0ABU7B2T8_9TELE|nr:hypothetical protein [Ataeniobius toweri]
MFHFHCSLRWPVLSIPSHVHFCSQTSQISSPFMPLFLTPERVPMIASWFLKFLRQTLFYATFPLVSSQVTLSESGQPLQQLPKEFPQLLYNNSTAAHFQHSLHMFAQTSFLCTLVNDLSALR